MSEHRKKITIRVSSQTAYHLEAEAERLGIADSLPPGGRGRAPGHIPWACGG